MYCITVLKRCFTAELNWTRGFTLNLQLLLLRNLFTGLRYELWPIPAVTQHVNLLLKGSGTNH